MDEMQELAIALHTLQCSHSHIDRCSWEYEDENWNRIAHEHYLLRAAKLYGKVSQEPPAIIEVVKALANL